MKDGAPNGFVRIITKFGDVIEGFIDNENSIRGIMRIIYMDGTHEIGWKRNDRPYGKFQGADVKDAMLAYQVNPNKNDDNAFKPRIYYMQGKFDP